MEAETVLSSGFFTNREIQKIKVKLVTLTKEYNCSLDCL